jgi:hypothetical protein
MQAGRPREVSENSSYVHRLRFHLVLPDFAGLSEKSFASAMRCIEMLHDRNVPE